MIMENPDVDKIPPFSLEIDLRFTVYGILNFCTSIT